MFEEELKVAVTTIVKKYPDLTHLQAYNTLQQVSFSLLIELEEQREEKKMKGWRNLMGVK